MENCNCCITYNAPDLMDGGVAAALIEKEAEQHDAAEAPLLTPDAITDEMI